MLSRPIINQSNISKFHQIIVKNVTASTALRIRLYANDGKDPCDKKDGDGGANEKCAEENKQRTCGEAGVESMLKQCAGATGGGGGNGDKCAKKKPECEEVAKNSCDKFDGDTQYAKTSSSRKKKLKECVPPTQMDAHTYIDPDKNISVTLYQNSEQNNLKHCFTDPEPAKNRRKTLKSCTPPPDWTQFDDTTESPSKSYRISTKANQSNPDEVNADAFETHTLEMLVKAVAKQVQANTFAIQNASIFRNNDDLYNDQGANKQLKMSQNTNQLRAASPPIKITNVSTPQIDSVLQYSTDGKKPDDPDAKKQIGRTLQEIIEDIENNYGKLPAPAGAKEQKTEGDQLMKSNGAPQPTSLGKLYDQADLTKLPNRGHVEIERSRPTHIPTSEGLPLPRSKPGQRGPPLTLDEFLKKLYEINVPQLRQTQAKVTPDQQTTPKQGITQSEQETAPENAQSTSPPSPPPTPPKTMSMNDMSQFRKIEIPFPKTHPMMKENMETTAPVKTSHSISDVLNKDNQQQQNPNLAPAGLLSSTNMATTAEIQNSDSVLRFAADSSDKKDQSDASKKASRITSSQLFENLNKPIKALTDKSLNDIFKNAETANLRNNANKNQRRNEKERGYDQFAKSFKIYKPPSEAQIKPTEVKPELPFEKMTPLNNLTPLEKHLMSMRAQKKTTSGKTVSTTLDPRFIPTLEGENRIDPTHFKAATTQSPTATTKATATKNPILKSTIDAKTATASAPVKAPETTNKGSGNVLKRFLKMIISYFSK